jgi:ATP/maltotriose-dependent transcriptional regulator MalT
MRTASSGLLSSKGVYRYQRRDEIGIYLLQIQRELAFAAEELRMLRLAADRASNDAIGQERHWSVRSIKRKMQHIFDKPGVAARAQAAAEPVRRGGI